MPTFEMRLAEIERQLGRQLTDSERHLMRLWYDTYGARDQAEDESPTGRAESTGPGHDG